MMTWVILIIVAAFWGIVCWNRFHDSEKLRFIAIGGPLCWLIFTFAFILFLFELAGKLLGKFLDWIENVGKKN
jgi:hypothetical protein